MKNAALIILGIFIYAGYKIMSYPRGIRNNNPGNIESNDVKWRGKIGNDGRFIKFDKMESGVRALALILINYYYKRGLVTVRQIINRYAPPTENDTGAYVQAVADAVGVSPDDTLPAIEPYLADMVAAIIKHENGRTIADYDIQRGVSLALQYKGLA